MAPPGEAVTVYFQIGRSGVVLAAAKFTFTALSADTPLIDAGAAGTTPSQPGNLQLAMRVRHASPGLSLAMYSLVYQNVQSSEGSTFIAE